MKKQVFLLALFVLSLLSASARGKVMKNPEFVFSNDPMKVIDRVEFRDTATVVVLRYGKREILGTAPFSYLEDEAGNKYPAKTHWCKEGKKKSGRDWIERYLFFEPMPQSVEVFDIHQTATIFAPNTCMMWQCWGVHDRKTVLDIPQRDLRATEQRMLDGLSRKGKVTVSGRFFPSVIEGNTKQIRVGIIQFGPQGTDGEYPFVVAEDGSFSYTVDLHRPTMVLLTLGGRSTANQMLLYLEPGKDVYLELDNRLAPADRLTIPEDYAFARFSRNFPVFDYRIFPETFPVEYNLYNTFISKQDQIAQVKAFGDYLAYKYKMTDEEAALLKSELRTEVCAWQTSFLNSAMLNIRGNSATHSFAEQMSALRDSITDTQRARMDEHLRNMFNDETMLICGHGGLLKHSLRSLLPTPHELVTLRLTTTGGVLRGEQLPAPDATIHVLSIDSVANQFARTNFGFDKPTFLMQLAGAHELSVRSINKPDEWKREALEVFARTTAYPALTDHLRQYMDIDQKLTDRYSKPCDLSDYAGYDMLQRITEKHRGKNVIILPLLTKPRFDNKQNTLHTRLDNLIHDFKDSPDVALVFICCKEWTTQEEFDRMRRQYLRDYPDVHLLSFEDFHNLYFMEDYNKNNSSNFFSITLLRDGKIKRSHIYALNSDGTEAEYAIRRGIRELLEAEKRQGNK